MIISIQIPQEIFQWLESENYNRIITKTVNRAPHRNCAGKFKKSGGAKVSVLSKYAKNPINTFLNHRFPLWNPKL